MNEHGSRGAVVQLASGLLFGLTALVLALLSQTRPLVAVGGYAILIGTASVGLFFTGPDSDRSKQNLQAWAAGDITLASVGIVSGVVFPGLVLAAGLGYFTWTPVGAGVAITVAGLYAIYGAVSIGQWVGNRPA